MWPDEGWTLGLTLLLDSPLPCFPQLWRHLKSSLRILFHHFFPKGEWASAWDQGDVGLSPSFHSCTLRNPGLALSHFSLQTSNPAT